MNRIVGGFFVLVLGSSVVAAKAEGQATPAEQYKALLREHEDALHAFAIGKTDEERNKAVARADRLPLLFLELAEKNPKDPIAVDALGEVVWMENTVFHPAKGRDGPGARALAILLRDHAGSDKIGRACYRVSFGIRRETETLLRTVLETNAHANVRALACVGLADFLNSRQRRLEMFKDRPDQAERYEGLLDKGYLDELRRQDPAKVAREVESLYEQAAQRYDDVKMPFGGTVGERARSELHELRYLSVGKEVPDIEGVDQEGKRFKLSDYRGKVVLLYFWQQY
jgi:hypothetical protein